MGFWDWLFGEKKQIQLSNGQCRTVTKRWWEEMRKQGRIRDVSESVIGVNYLRPTPAMLFDMFDANPIPTYSHDYLKIGEDVSEEIVTTHRDSNTGEMYAILMSKLVDRANMELKIVPEFCSREYWNEQAKMNGIEPR